MKRIPTVLAGVAIVVKLVAVVLLRAGSDGPMSALILNDPAPLWAARAVTEAMFDQRRLWPTAGEAFWFDAVLVLGAGVQWCLVGVVVQWVWINQMRRRRSTRVS